MKADAVTIQAPELAPATPARCYARRATEAPKRSGTPARQVWRVAHKEFGDCFRSGWVMACVVVWLGAIGLTSFFGLLQIGRIGVQGYERTVISLLNLVQYLVPLLGLLLGHDLLVSERETGTLRLLLGSGLSRPALLLGKFLGGCLSLAVPLLLGFAAAGAMIGLTARDSAVAPFLKLAASGLLLGVIFLAIGLCISAFSRTRVQSLVLVLLSWCVAVFVFDLVALGWLVSSKSPAAAQEIEVVCDATHVNAAADVHSDFNTADGPAARKVQLAGKPSLGWLALNPIDLFRAANLGNQFDFQVPLTTTILSVLAWLGAGLGLGVWKLRRTDL